MLYKITGTSLIPAGTTYESNPVRTYLPVRGGIIFVSVICGTTPDGYGIMIGLDVIDGVDGEIFIELARNQPSPPWAILEWPQPPDDLLSIYAARPSGSLFLCGSSID